MCLSKDDFSAWRCSGWSSLSFLEWRSSAPHPAFVASELAAFLVGFSRWRFLSLWLLLLNSAGRTGLFAFCGFIGCSLVIFTRSWMAWGHGISFSVSSSAQAMGDRNILLVCGYTNKLAQFLCWICYSIQRQYWVSWNFNFCFGIVDWAIKMVDFVVLGFAPVANIVHLFLSWLHWLRTESYWSLINWIAVVIQSSPDALAD